MNESNISNIKLDNGVILQENRLQIWNDYTGDKEDRVRHNFVDYDRYYEASLIESCLRGQENEGIKSLDVIDFGCCAGDYGIYFARLGCDVYFHDIDPVALDFVRYRLKRENLTNIDCGYYDLVIFGEVLEHLDSPLETIKKYCGSQYIFTSSYPYRTDDKNDSYWNGRDHREGARKETMACRELLEKYYHKIELGGVRHLWKFKG